MFIELLQRPKLAVSTSGRALHPCSLPQDLWFLLNEGYTSLPTIAGFARWLALAIGMWVVVMIPHLSRTITSYHTFQPVLFLLSLSHENNMSLVQHMPLHLRFWNEKGNRAAPKAKQQLLHLHITWDKQIFVVANKVEDCLLHRITY